MAAIEVSHPIENQMFTSKPVGDRMRGTAIRVPITDGPHTLVEEGAPTASIQKNNEQVAQLTAMLERSNAMISELQAAVGIAPKAAATVATAAVAATSASAAPQENTSASDEVSALEAQLAAAKAKLTGTDAYVAPAA